jgi:hypothetical protein
VDGLPHFVGDGAEVAGVTNLKVAEAPFALRVGEGVDVAGRLLEIMQLHVAGHADDHFVKGAAGAVIVADVKGAADGRTGGKQSAGHALTDDGHLLRGRVSCGPKARHARREICMALK